MALIRLSPSFAAYSPPVSERPAIFDDLLRGVPGEGRGEAAAEAFRDPRDVLADPDRTLLMSRDNTEGKIFLGLLGADVRVDAKTLPDGRLNRYAVGGTPIGVGDDRHIVTIAGSRAGKGRAALGPNLITYPGSVLVIDPKGDLAALTYDRRLALKQAAYVLDPFGASSRTFPECQFNPLDILDRGGEDLLADAGLIADALVVPTPGSKDPHWDEAARNWIEGLILHVATSPDYAGSRHLVTVHELLRDALEPADDQHPGVYWLEREMRESELADGAVAYAAVDFYQRSDRERDSVLSSARRHLHFLGYPNVQRTLKASSFDLQDLKRKRVSIFLSLPAMRMGSCARWLRLFVNLTLNAMERAKVPDQRYPVLVVLDEFAVLGTMKQIEDAAGQIAGLGVKLWVVLQDLGQLKALYSERWETFLGNAGVLQFFGNSELSTLEWIAKRLGTTGIVNESEADASYASRATGATGQSRANATAELMTAAEVARIFGRDDHELRQLIIRPTVPPLILQRAFYDTHGYFKGKFTELDRFVGR